MAAASSRPAGSSPSQRLSRAKARIRDAGIPYRVPGPEELPERLDGVLAVVYLVYTEGHTATVGPAVDRPDLCAEAVQLARDSLTEADRAGALIVVVHVVVPTDPTPAENQESFRLIRQHTTTPLARWGWCAR